MVQRTMSTRTLDVPKETIIGRFVMVEGQEEVVAIFDVVAGIVEGEDGMGDRN